MSVLSEEAEAGWTLCQCVVLGLDWSVYYPRVEIPCRQGGQGAPSRFLMLVGETEVPGGNSPNHVENMQTPLRKANLGVDLAERRQC